MTTASAPGARATARLLGPALLAATLAGATATACDRAPRPADAAPTAASTPTTSAAPTAASTPTTSAAPTASAAPEELCTRIVAHWSHVMLDSDTYGDYQSMGLSNGQYDILRTVLDSARAEKKQQGAAAAAKLIDRQAHRGCVDWYRSGGPGEGPWQ
ncbi:hypothetical protein [Streptomyces sp. LUP30]|uniref:hypothetical protein n=1 Tax=Streptomyces sp. LUP30 TaxID=1890285 RepID=UPI0009A06403|nr:hypothetical protein [Streptomyces sp. LUP30]